MNILAIIPARGGSKGIPKKNIISLNGYPLIHYQLMNAFCSNLINDTIVSSDDKDIQDIAKNIIARCRAEDNTFVIERPKELAEDNVMIEPVMDHAINWYKKPINIICVLPPTSPLMEPKYIDEALTKLMEDDTMDSIFTASEFHGFIWGKHILDDYYMRLFQRKRKRRQDMLPRFLENGGFYATKMSAYKRFGTMISGNIGMQIMPKSLSPEIDDYEDLKICEAMLKHDRGLYKT